MHSTHTCTRTCTHAHLYTHTPIHTQVLAFSLGLGTLVADEDKLRNHLKAEREYSDTDKGMVAVTGEYDQ